MKHLPLNFCDDLAGIALVPMPFMKISVWANWTIRLVEGPPAQPPLLSRQQNNFVIAHDDPGVEPPINGDDPPPAFTRSFMGSSKSARSRANPASDDI
jgi:hypothetical protein